MKVKDLIIALLDMPMNADVLISFQHGNGDYSVRSINSVEGNDFCRCVEISFKKGDK